MPQETSKKVKPQQTLSEKINTYSILYIEDNISNLKIVEAIITKRMKQLFICANTGGLGIEMALAHKPDIILLDLRLPGLDGYAVKEIINKEPSLSGIPIIALSANAMSEEIERVKESGFQEFISKPIDIPSFISSLNQYLE